MRIQLLFHCKWGSSKDTNEEDPSFNKLAQNSQMDIYAQLGRRLQQDAGSLFVCQCSSIQLSWRCLQRTAPRCKKWIMGDKNGQWILTINTLPPTFCTHQLVICQGAYQRFLLNFVLRGQNLAVKQVKTRPNWTQIPFTFLCKDWFW